MSFVLLSTTSDGRWHPGIGDPTFAGWLTVFGYFVVVILCLRLVLLAARRRSRIRAKNPEQAANEGSLLRLWGVTALLTVGLGVNKQLDLQSWFTQTARELSYEQGWYEQRRIYQFIFVVGILLTGTLFAAGMAYSLRRVLRRALGTVVGLAVVLSFVVIRAASFHHVDVLLSRALFEHLKINWVLELGGISILIVSTLKAARYYRR